MKQKHFMDIENLREFDTELRQGNGRGFEVGDIIQISEKADGANFSITYDAENDCLAAFSRKQQLSYDKTLSGAWNYATALDPTGFKNHPSWVVFGEWSVKNKIKYDDRFKNKWLVYDIYDTSIEQWLPQGLVRVWCEKYGFEYIHELYYGKFISWDHCRKFLHSPAYGNEQEGCFWSREKILMGDGTQKLIKDIEVGDIVKSYNINKKIIENKPVINVFFNGHKPLELWNEMLMFPRGTSAKNMISGKTFVTKNHMYFDGTDFSEIDKMDYAYHYGLIFDDFRFQAFLGMICSDGNLHKGMFKYSQHEDYMYSIEELFAPFLNNKKPVNISGKGSPIKNILFKKQITQQMFDEYGLGHNKFNYIKAFRNMDDIGWAFFFIGDGCAKKNEPVVNLDFSSYDKQEFDEILNIFSNRFQINPKVHFDKRVKNGAGLSMWLNAADGEKFLKRIAKYIVPSHRWKLDCLNLADEDYGFIGFPEVTYGLVKRKIYKQKPLTETFYGSNHKSLGAWDIEVEDNHNYFANGCLVHNCVVKNQTKLNNPDNKLPFYLKIVNENFKESMKTKEKVIDPAEESAKTEAQKIVESIVTKNRIEKELFKMRDEGILPDKIAPSDMKLVAQNLPKRIYDDCVKEEKELVLAAGEYFGKMCGSWTMKLARDIILGG